MSIGVVPLGKIVYVCDDVISDPVSSKLHILGVFDSLRVPPGDDFPYYLQRMCVIAQLAGGLGQMGFRVAVVDASTGDEVFGSPVYSVSMPGGNSIVTILIRMQDCPFPGLGTYVVQLFCGVGFIDDRRITVR